MKKSDPKTAPPAAEAKPAATPDKPEPPARRSAMKLPEGVSAAAPRGPQPRKAWDSMQGGRPQTDFARRAGKSRKVH